MDDAADTQAIEEETKEATTPPEQVQLSPSVSQIMAPTPTTVTVSPHSAANDRNRANSDQYKLEDGFEESREDQSSPVGSTQGTQGAQVDFSQPEFKKA